MAQTPEEYARWFNDTVNRAIGHKTGRTYNVQPYKPPSFAQQQTYYNKMADMAFLSAIMKSGSKSSSSNREGSSSESVDLVPNLRTAQSAEEIEQMMKNLVDGGSPLDNSVAEALGNRIPEPVRNRAKDVFERGVDVISRPLYAGFNAALEGNKAIDRGENPWTTLDDIAKGAWGGLSGKEKTTPGHLAEYITDPNVERNRSGAGRIAGAVGDAMQGALVNRELRDKFGENNVVSRNINRAGGAVGEIFLDPANLVGVGAASKVAKGINAGQNLTEATRIARAHEIVEDALKGTKFEGLTRKSITTPLYLESGGKHIPNAYGLKVSTTKQIRDELAEEMTWRMDDAVLNPNGVNLAMENAAVRSSIVDNAVASLRREYAGKFDEIYQQIKAGDLQINSQKFKALSEKYPLLKEFEDELAQLADDLKKNAKNKTPDIEEFISEAGKLQDEAYQSITKRIDDELQEVARRMHSELEGSTFNSPRIKIGKNKGIDLDFIGRGYAGVKNKTGVRTPRAISIKQQLGDGRFVQMASEARRTGAYEYDAFRSRIRDIARKYSRDDRRALSRHLQQGTQVVDEHLQEGLDLIRAEYKRMWDEEVAFGVRTNSQRPVGNYNHVQFKSDFRSAGDKFRKSRDNFKNKRKVVGKDEDWFQWGIEDAKKMGLRPVEDPFENLAYRKLESQRRIADARVKQGFIRYYGVGSKNLGNYAKQADLYKVVDPRVEVGLQGGKIPADVQAYARKTGNTIYLPKDVKEAFDQYMKWANPQSVDDLKGIRDYLQIYDKLLNAFKVSTTLPYPGFHLKNMVGDIFIGYLDGVRVSDYNNFLRPGPDLPIPGGVIGRGDFNELYKMKAGSGGMIQTDILPGTNMGTQSRVRQTGQWAREISEIREDFGRKVHFHKALTEEMDRLGVSWQGWNRSISDPKFIKALDNAAYRVDKFKFDYGSLTRFEKDVMRRVIPFYTFLRKSTPIMLEGMITNPALFGKTGRFFDTDLGPGIPNWLREIGYAVVGGGDEPMLLPSTLVPTDQIMQWGDPILSGDPAAFAKQAVEQMAPLPKTFIELGANKQFFTGAPIDRDSDLPTRSNALKYILERNVPPLATAGQIQRNEAPWHDFLLGNRLGLGTSVRRITQDQQIKNWLRYKDHYKRELEKISKQGAPFGVSISISERKSGTSVRVKRTSDKKILFDGDLKDALEYFDAYVQRAPKLTDDQQIVDYVDNEGVVQSGPRGKIQGREIQF